MRLFIGGCLIAIPVIYVENVLGYFNVFTVTGTDLQHLYTAFVVAAFTEEVFKWFVLRRVAYWDRAYDECLDGIVYGVFVSMGFAAVENIGYVFSNGYGVAAVRAFTALPGHMLFGVAMGYYFSVMKFAGDKKTYQRALKKSLIIPLIMHGFYDYILMSQKSWMLVFFVPYLIWMWFFGIKKISDYYQQSKEAYELRTENEQDN